MNTLLLTPADLVAEDRARVGGGRARHLIDVLGVRPGSRVRAGLQGDTLGWAEVVRCGEDGVEVTLTLGEAPPAKLPLTLVVGLPRPKAARRLVVDATAAGVERLILLGAWRVPRSYWQSPSLQPEAVARDVLRGLALGGDCRPPRVELHPRFKPFAEDELPSLARGARALVATPAADASCARERGRPSVVCVGPERGFTDYEQASLVAAGCQPVSLGARTLRVHAAVHVLIGRLF